MTTFRRLALVTAAMLVISLVALLTPAGRAIAQNVKPLLVEVTNDVTRPVPVVGTVGLSTDPSKPVPVVGTVEIDPAGNTVRAVPRGTRLVFDSGAVAAGNSVSTDISGSTKVRVWVKHVPFTDPINFVVAAAVPSDRFTLAGENDMGSGQTRNYLFEVISTRLEFSVTGSGQARFLVFGD